MGKSERGKERYRKGKEEEITRRVRDNGKHGKRHMERGEEETREGG